MFNKENNEYEFVCLECLKIHSNIEIGLFCSIECQQAHKRRMINKINWSVYFDERKR